MSQSDKTILACEVSSLLGAIGFAAWQGSGWAGLFMFFALDAVYMVARAIWREVE